MAEEDKIRNKYNIKILGEEIIVVGNFSEEYINKLAKFINKIGEELTRTYPRLPRHRILGLMLLNISDEHFKLKGKYYQKLKENNILEGENKLLKDKFNKLREEYDELLTLLEEVD